MKLIKKTQKKNKKGTIANERDVTEELTEKRETPKTEKKNQAVIDEQHVGEMGTNDLKVGVEREGKEKTEETCEDDKSKR